MNSLPITPIQSPTSLYIKLGESGSWEAECISNGTLRLGYRELPHDLCNGARWSETEKYAVAFSKDQGAATRHINQVRLFYEAPSTTLWITFQADRLWWCFGAPGIELLEDGTKRRQTTDGWHDCDVKGKPLYKAFLSGKLLATQGFQGTICSVNEHSYLLHKINGTVEPHVSAAQDALQALVTAMVPIIKRLHPKDLEVLIDLIFRQTGWNRTGVAGGIERDIDLDLLSPVTGERIAVQVKSRASEREYLDYRNKYADMRGYTRFYFVTHSPTARLETMALAADDQSFVFWGPQELASYAARNGLVGWLLDKAS
jgi:hypothetical protein